MPQRHLKHMSKLNLSSFLPNQSTAHVSYLKGLIPKCPSQKPKLPSGCSPLPAPLRPSAPRSLDSAAGRLEQQPVLLVMSQKPPHSPLSVTPSSFPLRQRDLPQNTRVLPLRADCHKLPPGVCRINSKSFLLGHSARCDDPRLHLLCPPTRLHSPVSATFSFETAHFLSRIDHVLLFTPV